ncbi:MAG: hypothetical protein O7C67_17840 [Gammaproteobacteria bacterium]|nr:hypothetical protein [Gammaproteobacteria bacterium]
MVKIGLHAVAALYTGGSLAQLLKLVYDFPWQAMPYFIDWIIVILGSVGAFALASQTQRIDYRGWWEKPVHFLIIAHLGISVALHLWAITVQSHDVFTAFPFAYSYFALVYFVFFAWRSWTLTLSRNGMRSDAQ